MFAPLPARAQAPSTVDASARVFPPELVVGDAPDYPAETSPALRDAAVTLRLSIDVTGEVTTAEVVESAGENLDAAAVEAAKHFRFTPARRGDQPVVSRIVYLVRFQEPVAAPPPPAAATAPLADTPRQAVVPQPAAAPVEVRVTATRTGAQRLQDSAEAVNVVELRRARTQTADLGEVLARSQGITVRRDGGLGSNTRFSLNGLYDDQVRFFLDGVPLELAGVPSGIANVPVNGLERVDVYRGVVPIRFGADALGGAVNVVSRQLQEPSLGASYQLGSFGTHRVTVNGRYVDKPTGFVMGSDVFFDFTKNNYKVDVQIPDDSGQLHTERVPRFHDAYRAYGANLEIGVVDRPWAKRLLINTFTSNYDKQLQNNVVMTVPYGEVRYGETVYGATARYEVPVTRAVDLEVIANYSHRTIDFVDVSKWVYDWHGQRGLERRTGGEIDARPTDQVVWQHGAFGRAYLTWAIAPAHSVRVSMSPTFTTRTGDQRIQADPNARDPLTAKRDLFTLVSGIEYELTLFEERLSNVLFVKDYYYLASTEDVTAAGLFLERDERKHSQGIGDSLRYRFTPWLLAKASYELATRLPSPNEVFGNGVRTVANLELVPETSHNFNIGPRVEVQRSAIGDLTVDCNAFWRESNDLIVLLGDDRTQFYQNVYKARAIGLENAVAWAAPGRWLSVDGTLTWQDQRNVSRHGAFGKSAGDRIPNRPYLFGSWGARLRFVNVLSADDSLEPFYNGRYVHSFYRGWESRGLREYKQVIAAQTTHSMGVSWSVRRGYGHLTTTLEVDNLTDAKVFDNFGVQRPGRAFYLKLTGDVW